jgi:hypothetical protein
MHQKMVIQDAHLWSHPAGGACKCIAPLWSTPVLALHARCTAQHSTAQHGGASAQHGGSTGHHITASRVQANQLLFFFLDALLFRLPRTTPQHRCSPCTLNQA